MPGILHRSLLFLFILVSMLGFAGKASAQYMNYQVYTLFYREGEPVTVWVACDYGWHIGYTLSGGALSAYRAPGIYAVALPITRAPLANSLRLVGTEGETIHLGALGAGTYTIFVFGALPNGVLLLYQNFIANIVYTMTVGELYTANLFDNYGITGSGEGNYELLGTNGYYSKTFDVCVSNYGSSCAYNSCGDPNGYIQCDGSCSASPVERSYWNQYCSSPQTLAVINTEEGITAADPAVPGTVRRESALATAPPAI